jgi:hypothetical protein
MSPINTVEKQCGRFQKGRSGNPSGRPKGSRNTATMAAECLLDGQARALTEKCIAMALEGDPVALRLCLERILPPRKDRPVTFSLPPINGARDAADLSAAVVAAVSNGDITLSEAAEIGKLIDGCMKAHNAAELGAGEKPIEKWTDEEILMRLAEHEREKTAPALPTQRLLVASRP